MHDKTWILDPKTAHSGYDLWSFLLTYDTRYEQMQKTENKNKDSKAHVCLQRLTWSRRHHDVISVKVSHPEGFSLPALPPCGVAARHVNFMHLTSLTEK